jgi:hypothetical protein
MEKEHIRAIGNFLAFYSTDLNYIKKFQEVKKDFKKDALFPPDYIKKGEGTFYSFLTEFGVKRNISGDDAVDKLLNKTLSWVNSKYANDANDVDLFTKELTKIKSKKENKMIFLTRRNKAISLASKILFLNNPWEIIPKDTNTTNAFKPKPITYDHYKKKFINFRETEKNLIEKCLDYVNPLVMIIEKDFGEIKDINIIRKNRILDKLLMYTGNNALIV